MRRIMNLAASPWLALLFRLYIGSVFIYASMSKIIYTGEFAENIAAYQILPWWLVNFTAAVLPWMEIICGVLLIIGVRVKSAALCIAGMLVVFSVAIGLNLIKGTPISCGCFSSLEEEMSIMTLVRDLVWLGMTLHVFFFDRVLQLERSFLVAVKET